MSLDPSSHNPEPHLTIAGATPNKDQYRAHLEFWVIQNFFLNLVEGFSAIVDLQRGNQFISLRAL